MPGPIDRFGRLAVALLAAAGLQAAERIELTVGGSAVIDYPAGISRISTSNPDVVDPVPVSKREVLLQGKSYGLATVVIWSPSGERTFYSVTVGQDLEPLRKLLRETFPQERIEVQAGRDAIALTGEVSTAAVAERAVALATPFGKSVVNQLQVARREAEKQVLLRVRFAEVDRNAASALGANVILTGALNTVGRTTTGQFPAPNLAQAGAGTSGVFTLSDALNVFAFRPDLNLGAFVKALQTQGLLQILAEPNLVATEGKEASFLAGGEFPVPVVQGGANVGAVTIQFREFGIRLSFTPLVTDRDTIKLHVKPEVSSLDFANGLQISGFLVPALSTRRLETHIELRQGQSFAIAGLLDDRVTENLSRVPGLASIPLLGALFKSRQVSKSKTELLVLVTPEIARAVEATAAPSLKMPQEFLKPEGEGGAQRR
jgi:pilus assembly protein CpaC